MKSIKITLFIGVFLILLGIAAVALEQISYTRREKVLELGPFEATMAKDTRCYRLPVAFGLLAVTSGVALIALWIKKRS